MSLKSLIITVLALSNLFTLLVLYQYREGFELVRRFKYISSSGSLTPEERGRESVDYLLKQYADAIISCGAAVAVGPVSSLAGTAEWDMACLIAGKRDVVWLTFTDVEDSLFYQISAFKNAIKAEGIQTIDKFSFRAAGERRALLLAKYDILKRIELNYNSYLLGLLLGYEVSDIEFFDQRNAFSAIFSNDTELPFSYAKFSDEMKKQFQEYLKNEWITSGAHDRFETDKFEANTWIAEQEQYSNEQLYQQIDELKQQQEAA